VSIDHPSQHIIASLQADLAKEAKAYGASAGSYALLDFPMGPNIGDSLIWLGELIHLKALFGFDPNFVSGNGAFPPDALRNAVPCGPIFIRGGGNFGDLWPENQQFRETVIEQFPDRQIIQLPQSVHFDDPALVERAARVIKAHPNFLLFVRDKRSFEFARSHFQCPVYLTPDMAFCIGAIARPLPAKHKLLLMLRTDHECARAEFRGELPLGAVVTDWLDEDPTLYPRLVRQTALFSFFKHGFAALSKSRYRGWLFENLAHERLKRGIGLLSSAEFVITDRLHCHILCTLLGIPHIVLDNSYGKVSSFVDTWTKDSPLVTVAQSLNQAIDLYTQRSSGHPSA
jgi:pyruvyl transferase EpsO